MKMTANRRIWLNIAATYARNIYSLALGLVTARWLLLSLGQTDYGLFGVVGGLIAFVTFFNGLLSGAVSRFYSISVGKASVRGFEREGLDECRSWFTVALFLHSVVPLALLAVGYPLGEYAVRHWLVIPVARISSCLWVWRFACLTAFVSMANVPFRAMYAAKQELAEMTIYSVAGATLNAVLLYYMVEHPGDWLAKYAFWHCLIAILPQVCMGVCAAIRYPECRICPRGGFSLSRIRRLSGFVGWNSVAEIGRLVRSQGTQIAINLLMGPVQNASITVAARLAKRANTFSVSIAHAFSPAITMAYGAGNLDRMRTLTYGMCKFGSVVVAVISLPLFLEVQEVMRLWLGNPPESSQLLCACVLAELFFDKISNGFQSAIIATGRIAGYQAVRGGISLAALLATVVLLAFGLGLKSIGAVIVLAALSHALSRSLFAHLHTPIAIKPWLTRVLLPVLCSVAVAFACGWIPRLFLSCSFTRVVVTTVVSETFLLPLVWRIVLDESERHYVRVKLAKAVRRTKGV